jgi:hypothetical protein
MLSPGKRRTRQCEVLLHFSEYATIRPLTRTGGQNRVEDLSEHSCTRGIFAFGCQPMMADVMLDAWQQGETAKLAYCGKFIFVKSS